MPSAILITQCIQRDFVEPIGPHEPPPNLLHVGHREASRLLGADPASGPLAQLMRWARAQDPRRLAVVHVRDRHDAGDPAQRAHLDAFGSHCVAGTRGAELVLDLERDARPEEIFVDAIGLADVEETDLGARLAALTADATEPVRIAVVGVWTDAKVTFLLYDLATRLRIPHLATSSALTASASRSAHFHALEQLRRVLGVSVLDSVGELADFLVPESAFVASAPAVHGHALPIEGAELGPEERAIASHLFRDAARVSLRALGGGFSGARVWTAESSDALGHRQAPTVLKIAPRRLIGEERAAFERVEPILGNDAPRLLGVVDGETLGGLRWSFASMGGGKVRTLKSIVESDAPVATVDRVLRTALEEVLGRFSSAASYEPLPLLSYYRFSRDHAPSVRRNASAAAGPGDRARVEELVAFYERGLDEIGASPGEHHYVSYVHGDLNGANVLVDERENVWLIDFFHAKRGHVINDVVKLENDLLFLFTPFGEDDLEAGRAMLDALLAVEDLRAPLPDAPPEVAARPALARTWAIVRTLRSIAAGRVREDRDATQWSIAALRYSAHTLSFDEASPTQRRLALHASAGHARAILADVRRDRALRIDFVPGVERGRLGLTICPGRRDRGRDLDRDLEAIAATGARVLVSLPTAAELAWAGVADLAERAAGREIEVIASSIRDQGVPTLDAMRALVADVRSRLERGETVVAHCMGGLGRSGLLAACVLVDAGATPRDAIARVREARGPRAVETAEQEAFVVEFASR